jgi:hypothetical protein
VAQRQAWCPRCDEVLSERPGRPCPICGSTLLAVPTRVAGGHGPSARPDLRAALWRARGQALPAARAGIAGLVAVALVAGMFLVGRITRASSVAGAAATSTTAGRFDPEGDSQVYNWQSGAVEGVELSLRSIDAGDRYTTLRLRASGIPDALSIATLKGLSITDAGGHQLLRNGPVPEVPARGRGLGGEQFAQVNVEDRLTDKAAVDRVQVDAVTLTNQVEEELAVTVVDPRLRHPPLRGTDPCPGCKLDVHCATCPTMAVAGATYHQGEVVVLLAPKGPVDRSVLGGLQPDVVVNDRFGSQVPPAVDREPGGGVTTVEFSVGDLAAGGSDTRLQIQVIVSTELRQTVKGPWRMQQR